MPKATFLLQSPLHLTSIERAALVAVSLAGILAFALPFFVSAIPSLSYTQSRAIDASILLAVVVGATVIVTVGELTRGPAAGSLSRSVALLGVLVAIDASLRLIPSFLGASPVFALIVLVGYVFGSRFGFVMGALTLLLSAAITAGVGPWLPFQMLCAGWIGMAAGWLPHARSKLVELCAIAGFGVIAGFAYGALMNLYSWPFAAPGLETGVGIYWSPALSIGESIQRYALFYVATSFAHDATRAAANAAILLIAGGPVLRLLQRFLRRTGWTVSGTEGTESRIGWGR